MLINFVCSSDMIYIHISASEKELAIIISTQFIIT